ncbi:PREDICTED: uncharacterized protein LOC108545346 isoform X1 [Eufriesea mexicana]|uniref:uncharacterized protein LOC108545346 isoform X1 n=1 Tax=Eufriesea mexicana TaxID=516756 RepID=UPI00083C282A|nr:PREDICTED: uncharacterized protein LOC108545346 isoform X1 [Eufriesea mexicana]XP_017752393.1 PREDICTED: uncharacterized protein LOC108545346 isoform X1 [Eufriesea mexicana]
MLNDLHVQAIVENHDIQNIIEGESRRSSSVDYLDTFEDIPKETVKEFPEETKEKLFEEEKEKETTVKNESKSIETEKKEASQAAGSRTSTDDNDDKGVAKREENATRIEATTSTTTGTIDGRNENVPVGEWNSLPLLVERLRAALELSLGGRRNNEPPALPEDSGVDSEEDFRIRSSMEQALGNCKEPEIKKDLKFLEDLLLSDIQTALSRLRETLEKIDVTALAKHGAASDPTSKLQLLRLVSSLLSRLQVPEEATEKIPVLPSTSLSRRRRGTRHTIGVSAEELAKARKWLEEERNALPLEGITAIIKEQKEQCASGNGINVVVDRKPEEIRDKCTKDAINQRQLLEDKNKEIRDNCAFRGIQQVDVADTKTAGELNMFQPQYRANSYQDKENNENIIEDSEERSRVSKLAAVLRQRAELTASGGGKYGNNNKFSAKKSKIKRANTIDIPSYLKLQAESLGHETTGCVSLRKPINVGDKAFNSTNVTVPTFQPKTENDRKFLALINKNNEAPTVAPIVPFKTFGQTMDMSSLTNENWNSRFSNIKTTFDKPSESEERENKPSLKSRANKMFPCPPQTQVYSNSNPIYNPHVTKMDTSMGFRHAPSSPFRKIEKSSPGSPSKIPPSYQWPKNTPVPTNTLKEKARMMFDREGMQPSSKSSRINVEKPSFPRPPWIEHEWNENRANDTVTENGKLDYRSFCKQFAPFVTKTSSMESKKLEEQRQREKVSGVVDGKISFKVVPDKRVQTHQYLSAERRNSKEKIDVAKSGKEHRYSENSFTDATLRGCSSVAIQTGINEEHQDEGRSFKVTPRISKGQNLICTNAAVQTSSELNRPIISVNDIETEKQWIPLYYEQSDSDQVSEDRQRFILDHNQNYHTVSSDSDFNSPVVISGTHQVTGEQDFKEIVQIQGLQSHEKQAENPVKSYQNEETDKKDYSPSLVSPISPNYNHSDEILNTPEQQTSHQKTEKWSIEDSNFPDDQNIQNQDISPEIGVVTRYTCAIGTVASSVDSPEPRSEEVAVDSRTSSSPSPSQSSWSRSRPPTNETLTSEDEIRRHNLLQQSLVRRLQNEITSLNDQPHHSQSSNFGQHLTVSQGQSRYLSQSPNLIQSRQQQNFNPSTNIPSSQQQQSYSQSVNVAQNIPHQQQKFNQSVSTVHQQQHFSQPANFDRPSSSQGSSRFAKYLAPVPQKKKDTSRAHSPGSVSGNRVGALKEAYEQVPNSPTKPIQKERSPVPNGVAPIDSSDEYLVSCATKPSRSIVLSKSESWHQLALSNRYPRAPRMNVPASTTSFPHNSHTKPPKPRSPSSQKLRSKQFEASSMADSVKKMEDKIRQYFNHPTDIIETKESVKHRRSPRFASKEMVGLSRSRTMPGLSDEKLRLSIPTSQQVPLLNVNTTDVDKVFDDLFEEATRTDNQ